VTKKEKEKRERECAREGEKIKLLDVCANRDKEEKR
jgi:hypothetical protein